MLTAPPARPLGSDRPRPGTWHQPDEVDRRDACSRTPTHENAKVVQCECRPVSMNHVTCYCSPRGRSLFNLHELSISGLLGVDIDGTLLILIRMPQRHGGLPPGPCRPGWRSSSSRDDWPAFAADGAATRLDCR